MQECIQLLMLNIGSACLMIDEVGRIVLSTDVL